MQTIARIRLREAKALLNAGFPDGAYYLAGYSLECGLKACIAKATRRHDFPDRKRVNDSYTHKLRDLVRLSELEEERMAQVNQNPTFKENWDLAQQWSEDSRYERHDADAAAELIAAIDNRKHGVMTWLKRHW